MCANSSSKRGRDPFAGGANVAAQPTCMCALGLSTARNDASRADSRWGGMAGLLLQWFRPWSPCGPTVTASASRLAGRTRIARRASQDVSDVARERVAGARVTVVEAALEPARALLGGAVREGLR